MRIINRLRFLRLFADIWVAVLGGTLSVISMLLAEIGCPIPFRWIAYIGCWLMAYGVWKYEHKRRRRDKARFKKQESRMIADMQDLREQLAKLQQRIDDEQTAIADVQHLFHKLASKAKSLKPKKFADCAAWVAVAKEAMVFCLGEHRCLNFNYPESVDDTPGRAKDILDQWANGLAKEANSLSQQDVLRTCTRAKLEQFRTKHGL